MRRMPAYKDEQRGTWYCQFYYEDWQGVKKKKQKRLIIKERLGHRDIKITLNTYGHLYPSQQKQVAEMLNQQRQEKSPNSGKKYCYLNMSKR